MHGLIAVNVVGMEAVKLKRVRGGLFCPRNEVVEAMSWRCAVLVKSRCKERKSSEQR